MSEASPPADQDRPDDAWHRPLRHTPAAQASPATAQSPGMHRLEGISGHMSGSERIWMGENRVDPGVSTSDHHHGESETGIYVVSGNPRFVFGVGGQETAIDAGPGDYVYVPPWTPHREENPSPTDSATVVLARSTQDAIVVNVTDLTG
ncbi:MAG: cupin domain-containing protein [Actinomycetota bacterium]|nr:cupin domain-containing protein [Actinomycetota bacterium]MDQ6945206.1 cupin domain-containing protein [Actinomycetota bacterium]